MHAEQKRPRKRKKGLQLHPERHPDVSKLEIRYLPPSTMKEHWETMQSLDGREAVSFGTFWKTWHREYPHLQIRPASSHTQCTNCIRYKLMIRQLSNHLCARQNQQELLNKHLMAQYRDRQVYWALRGSSRLRLAEPRQIALGKQEHCRRTRKAACLSVVAHGALSEMNRNDRLRMTHRDDIDLTKS